MTSSSSLPSSSNPACDMKRRLRLPFVLLCIFCGISFAIGLSANSDQFSVGRTGERPSGAVGQVRPGENIIEFKTDSQNAIFSTSQDGNTLTALIDALDVLQDDYFAVWQGMWPTSIDWTSAVMGTFVSSALTTLSTSFASQGLSGSNENLINKYFSQVTGSYFGQDAFGLRQEAYDDMLWVVLGWIESIKFINIHSSLHYSPDSSSSSKPWYGEQWIPAFAHRARIFWDLASQGWDTSLCNGGMIWSPYLVPYKNAITNELYITASVSMYLYFPGDKNDSPFSFSSSPTVQDPPPGRRHDPKYLDVAVEAYDWLKRSNMTDSKGLYVDGYHVSGWSRESRGNTRCDSRNEMVYTYNQGVLLSGQRGLYEATGEKSYLEDGHRLVQDVIAATGWDLITGKVRGRRRETDNGITKLGPWRGIGREGILEEACDASAYCSQDSQTFKGIFFHHLSLFCSKLPLELAEPRNQATETRFGEDKRWHDANCETYAGWIKHNAEAALSTRDLNGRFGMWWGAPKRGERVDLEDGEAKLPHNAVDYRNSGLPRKWIDPGSSERESPSAKSGGFEPLDDTWIGAWDLNDRGRGRTVETQGGGLTVLKALWEAVENRQ